MAIKDKYQTFFKHISWPALATGVNTLSAIILYKLIATLASGSGIALIAHFQNLINIFSGPSIDGPNNGALREISKDSHKLSQVLISALLMNLLLLLITIGTVFASSHFLFRHFESEGLTGNTGVLFIVAVGFQASFSLLNNILLGQSRLRLYALLIILCPTITFSVILLNGGVISITTLLILISTNNLPSILFLVYIAIKERWVKTINKHAIWQEFRLMSRFLVMGISIALFGKATLFIIRDGLLEHFGLGQTNLWQSVIKLSDGYTGLYLALMSSVFFPYVSSLLDKPHELRSFLRKYLTAIALILLPLFFLIFLFRAEILTLFYKESYIQAQNLFSVQLLTDYLKFISWGIGFVMYAQARSLLFFVLEILSYSIYLTASYLLVREIGLIGVMYAELLQYIVYTAILFFLYRKLIFGKHV